MVGCVGVGSIMFSAKLLSAVDVDIAIDAPSRDFGGVFDTITNDCSVYVSIAISGLCWGS